MARSKRMDQTHNHAKIEKNIHKNKHKQNNQSKTGQRMAAPPNLNETLSPMFAQKRIGQHKLRSGREAKRNPIQARRKPKN